MSTTDHDIARTTSRSGRSTRKSTTVALVLALVANVLVPIVPGGTVVHVPLQVVTGAVFIVIAVLLVGSRRRRPGTCAARPGAAPSWASRTSVDPGQRDLSRRHLRCQPSQHHVLAQGEVLDDTNGADGLHPARAVPEHQRFSAVVSGGVSDTADLRAGWLVLVDGSRPPLGHVARVRAVRERRKAPERHRGSGCDQVEHGEWTCWSQQGDAPPRAQSSLPSLAEDLAGARGQISTEVEHAASLGVEGRCLGWWTVRVEATQRSESPGCLSGRGVVVPVVHPAPAPRPVLGQGAPSPRPRGGDCREGASWRIERPDHLVGAVRRRRQPAAFSERARAVTRSPSPRAIASRGLRPSRST